MSELALQRSLSDVVAEYDHKLSAIPQAISAFEKAAARLKRLLASAELGAIPALM
jgi:hypothetical protein